MSFWSEKVLPRAIDRVCGGEGPSKHRSEIVPLASGRVLDVGVGSGLNLAYADPERVTAWVGLDPSAELLERAGSRASAAPFDVELVLGRAERLPFADASFDAVVVTYTFCSVDDPDAVVREIARVIAPHGKLLFAEHGLATRRASREIQRRIEPAWQRVAGGCRLQRDFVATVRATGRFEFESIRERENFPRWMSTVTSGVAIAV